MGVEAVDQVTDDVIDLSDDVDELDRDREEPEDSDGTDDEAGEKTDGEDKAEDGEKGGEGDAAGEDGGEGEGKEDAGSEGEGENEDPPVDKTKEEISSLRQMVRAQRNQLKDLEGQLKKQNDALVDKDIIAEDEVSEVDVKANEQRSEVLDQMVELMELNPKYEDVKSVCTQSNFDDVTETLAKAYVAEHGGDELEVAGQIAEAVWSKANPYKEMYGLVKQYHPEFAGKASDAGGKDKLEQAKDTAGKKTGNGKDAAPSLSSMSGGGGSKTGGSGWTSQRIDQLSEEELNDVPADIYDKYMMGTLD